MAQGLSSLKPIRTQARKRGPQNPPKAIPCLCTVWCRGVFQVELLRTSGHSFFGRKPEGQQLKGKIVSALLHTSTLFSHLISVGGKKPVLKRLVRHPKGSPEFCGTFGVLQEGSAERFTYGKKLVEERFCRTPKVLQNFGSQAQLFRPCKFFSHSIGRSPTLCTD